MHVVFSVVSLEFTHTFVPVAFIYLVYFHLNSEGLNIWWYILKFVIHLQLVIQRASYSYMECSLTIVMHLSVEASPSITLMHQRLVAAENPLQRRNGNMYTFIHKRKKCMWCNLFDLLDCGYIGIMCWDFLTLNSIKSSKHP